MGQVYSQLMPDKRHTPREGFFDRPGHHRIFLQSMILSENTLRLAWPCEKKSMFGSEREYYCCDLGDSIFIAYG